MTNTPPVPPERSSQPGADKVTETAARDIETTGSQPVVVPDGDSSLTVRRTPSSPVVGPQKIGDFTVFRMIGEGGMGTVYLAEDAQLGRKVAIKTMKAEVAADKTNADRFVREARAAATVEHDNIVPILHIGKAADGTPFIVMPFLQGEPLDVRLKREPVAGLSILLKVAREVSDGLAAAHAAGLIHRDIKPANVWLEGNPKAPELAKQIRRSKILDFGLARSACKEDVQITAAGAVLGTPAYMAPEQARGEKVDHRADLFSLGVMLYRMATGKLPFNGPNAMAVLIALTTETPTPVQTLAPNLPSAVVELIERLMRKDRTGRPQSAAEVSAAVRAIVKSLQVQKLAPASEAPPVQVVALPNASEVSASLPRVIVAPVPNVWEGATETDEDEDEVAAPIPKVRRRKGKEAKRNRNLWYLVVFLGLLAFAAIFAVVFRIGLPTGTLVVEISSPAVEADMKKGKLVLLSLDGKERYVILSDERTKTIDAGTYMVRIEGANGLTVDTREFTLKKGDKVTVRVTLEPKALAKKETPPKNGDPLTGQERRYTPAEISNGLVVLPEPESTRLLRTDTFQNPTSVRDGYDYSVRGRFSINTSGTLWWVIGPTPTTDFACEVVLRTTGASGERGGLVIRGGRDQEWQAIQLLVNPAGEVTVEPWVYSSDAHKASAPKVQSFRPKSALASSPNTLTVIIRGKLMEVYLNKVAVSNPIEWTGLTGDILLQGLGRDPNGRVVFSSIRVWTTDGVPTPFQVK